MKKNTIKRVLTLIKPYRVVVAASLILALLSAVVQLLIPVFCGGAIDAMLGAGNVKTGIVIKNIVLIAAAAVLGALTQNFLAVCNNKITFSVCRDLRGRISNKINSLPLSYLDVHPIGDTVSRTVTDVDTFADGLLMGFTQLFTGIVTILTTLGIMLYLNLMIALVVVVLTPLSIFVAKFISQRINRFFKEQACGV